MNSSSPVPSASPFADEGSGKGPSSPNSGSPICSDEEAEIEAASEPMERYTEEIYYPVYIGEVLVDRYRVVHKLGWGGFSTVWMAQDLETQKLVALKIGIPGDMAERELKMNQEILDKVSDPSRLVTLQNTFSLQGPKATHLVMVLPVRGPSLSLCRWTVPLNTRMAAARPLLLAIKSLHDADIIHCDINNGSVLFDMGDITSYTPEMVCQKLGRPRKMPIWYDTWKKGELVIAAQADGASLGGNVSLGDFGLALKSGSEARCKWQAHVGFCAPERLHGVNPSFASDMWSYMCVFAALYLRSVPFGGRGHITMLSYLVDSLGPLPREWAGTYAGLGTPEESWYDQACPIASSITLEQKSRRSRPEVNDAERKLVLSVFSKVLRYLPEDRFTAAQLLEDEEFNELLAIYGC